MIDGPDEVATVVFQVPETKDKNWVADGEFRDSNGKEVGRVQFCQVFNPHAELASLEAELNSRLAQAKAKESSSFGQAIFWGVLGILCVAWFFESPLKTSKDKSTAKK